LRANVLLISQSSSQNDICFIVSAGDAERTVEALRREFAGDLSHEVVEHITVDPKIAIVAVVGENMRGTRGVAGRTFAAMGRDNVNIIAIAQGSSETNISFVVEDSAMKQALLSAHNEFGLAGPRNLGVFRDQMTVPDDFDAPLPDDILNAFEGKARRGRKKS
jgi:aspartokinase